MIHEKILEREDGTQYQICVKAYLDLYRYGTMKYRVDIFYKQKGNRKWLHTNNKNNLRFVTQKEIYEAKIELWNLIKPQL